MSGRRQTGLLILIACAAIGCRERTRDRDAPSRRPAPVVVSQVPPPLTLTQPPAAATTLPSGLKQLTLKAGSGSESPRSSDAVWVHFTAWDRRGNTVAATASGKPDLLPLALMMEGFREGVRGMVEGEKRRLWIPSLLAYGDDPRLREAPAGPLVVDVDLLSIERQLRLAVDLAQPPAAATRTPSGIAYLVLREGAGVRSPNLNDTVVVNYTGWTTDGEMFASSRLGQAPATYHMQRMIDGWKEILLQMKAGEKRHFWVPPDLAYGKKPRSPALPAGQLVFELELLAIGDS